MTLSLDNISTTYTDYGLCYILNDGLNGKDILMSKQAGKFFSFFFFFFFFFFCFVFFVFFVHFFLLLGGGGALPY